MASGQTLLVFTPGCNQPPATGYATPDARNAQWVLDFDDTADETALFSAVMPRHYSGGGLTVTIGWMATSAVPELIATGDVAGKLTHWSLAGASLSNSDGWCWYWDYVAPPSFPGPGTVTLFRDAAKTQKVAEGSGSVPAGSGSVTINLAPQNGSGLSGSVQVGFNAPTDNDAANMLAYNRVAWQVALERHQDDVDDLDADSFALAQTVYDIPASAPGKPSYASVALAAGAAMDNIAAGEHFRLKLTRRAGLAIGNMIGDAELLFLELTET